MPDEPELLPAPCENERNNPKRTLAEAAGVQQKELSAEQKWSIARAMNDMALVRTRCPLGFAPFAEEVQRHIAPSVQHDSPMKTAYFTGPRQLELRDEPEPTLSDAGDVLVRIERLGVCRSDVHYYVEGRIGDDRRPVSRHAGTRMRGNDRRGRLGGGEPRAGRSRGRRSGGVLRQVRPVSRRAAQHVPEPAVHGLPGPGAGAAAEYRILPATNCFIIPDAMSMDEAVLVEPLSIGLHAARLAAMKPGARAAILGVGPIGLGVLLCVKALAPATVHATDLIDSRLDAARRCGADSVTSATRDDVVATIGREEPLGLDVVFECSGDPACLDQAQELLAPGGTLVMVGIPPTVRVDFDAHLMRRKGLTFKAVRRQNECVAPVIELMASGRLDARGLVTHHFPLESIREAFELVAGYRDGVIKAVIEVSPGE